MKGNIIMGILWIIVAICLAGILFLKLNGKNDRDQKALTFDGDNFTGGELSDSFSFNENDVRSLEIFLASESLYIEKTSSNQVEVELYVPKSVAPEVELNGGVLKIESKKNKFFVSIASRKVIVKLPSGFDPEDVNLKVSSGSIHLNDCDFPCDLDCGSSSGSVHFTNLNCKNLNVRSSSGSVHFANITCKDLNAKSSSGSIRLNNVNGNNLELEATSGSVRLENSQAQEARVHSSSGSIRVDGSYDGINFSASSGSVHVDLNKPLTKDSELHSSSGSITLSVPSDAGFNTRYGVTSGNYRNSITGTSGKSGSETVRQGGPLIQLSTTSGSIRVE